MQLAIKHKWCFHNQHINVSIHTLIKYMVCINVLHGGQFMLCVCDALCVNASILLFFNEQIKHTSTINQLYNFHNEEEFLKLVTECGILVKYWDENIDWSLETQLT